VLRAAGAPVSDVEPVMDPVAGDEVALMLVVPLAAFTVASPLLAPMLATDGFELNQLRPEVRGLVFPSLNVPVAAYCWVEPLGSVWLAGVTATDTRTAGAAVSTVEPLIAGVPAMVALIVLVPAAAFAVARPVGEMMATAVLDAHVTALVMSWVLESL